VAQADLEALSARFERDRAGLTEARFAESLPAGSAVAAASISYGEPDVQFDHAAGEPAEAVTMTVTQAATGLVFDADQLMAAARPLLEEELQQQVPAGYALDPGEIAFSAPSAAEAVPGEPPSVVVTAAGSAVYRFAEEDRTALVERLSGESAGEADEILAGLPAVESYAVDYFPGFLDRMPSRSSRVQVVVAE
jgi:hypothetical protein